MNLKRRIIKIGFILLVSAITVVLLFPIVFKSYIKNKLVQMYNESQSHFTLEIGNLNILLLRSGIELSDVELKTTDSISENPLSSFKAQSISIKDVSIFKLIYSNRLEAGKLGIISPTIIMNRIDKNQKGKQEKEEQKGEKKKSINISKIEISDPHFEYFLKRADTVPLFQTDKGNISIREFNVDTLKKGKDFSAYDIEASLRDIKFVTDDSLYTIQISQLQVSYSETSLRIDSFEVIPNYSKKDFGRKAGYQTDRMAVSIPLIMSNTFDAKSFVERQMIIADSMEIKSFLINPYRDKNIFSKIEYPKTVQEKLNGIVIPFSVNHLTVLDGEVFYEELRKGSNYPGHISFEHIRSEIENISNFHPEDTLRIIANSLFGGKSKFDVLLEFPMAKDDNSFFCKGNLGAFSAKTFNTMLPVIAGVAVEDGYINSVKFEFHATMTSSLGYVDMNYKDLKFAIVNPVDGKSQSAEKKIASFFANTFVVKSDVPSKSSHNTIGKINYKRDPEAFVFNYSWKSIFNGVKKVVTGKED